MSAYRHTQTSPMWLILLLFIPLFVIGGAGSGNSVLLIVFLSVGAGFLLLAASITSLTVQDAGDHLRVRFGPLPLFGTRLKYADMAAPAVSRSRTIDGWGIHWIPGRGWTYNIWGYDCVEMQYRGSPLRIGTDEAANLARFLSERIAALHATHSP